MRKLFNLVSTVKKELLYILLGDILFIIVYNVWLLRMPEEVSWGYEVGVILHTLSLAYISAFIFFFVNIHHSQFEGRVKGRIFIHNKIVKIHHLNSELQRVLKKLSKVGNEEDGLSLTEEQIELACEKISVKNPVTVSSQNVEYTFEDWFQYFNYLHEETLSIIFSVTQQNLYTDDELFKILFDIENNFDNFLNRFKGNQTEFEKDNLEFFSDGIKGFDILTKKLMKYKEKLNKYKI